MMFIMPFPTKAAGICIVLFVAWLTAVSTDWLCRPLPPQQHQLHPSAKVRP